MNSPAINKTSSAEGHGISWQALIQINIGGRSIRSFNRLSSQAITS